MVYTIERQRTLLRTTHLTPQICDCHLGMIRSWNLPRIFYAWSFYSSFRRRCSAMCYGRRVQLSRNANASEPIELLHSSRIPIYAKVVRKCSWQQLQKGLYNQVGTQQAKPASVCCCCGTTPSVLPQEDNSRRCANTSGFRARAVSNTLLAQLHAGSDRHQRTNSQCGRPVPPVRTPVPQVGARGLKYALRQREGYRA